MTNARALTPVVTVVDGDPADYLPFQTLAETDRIDLRFVTSGRSALWQCRQVPPDLWIVNTQLPDYDGITLAEMLLDTCPSTHLFLVSDVGDPACEMRALQLGVTAYLVKPVHSEWLHSWNAPPKPARLPNGPAPQPGCLSPATVTRAS